MGCGKSAYIISQEQVDDIYDEYMKEIDVQVRTGDLFLSFGTKLYYETSYNYYIKCIELFDELIKKCNDKDIETKVKFNIENYINPRLKIIEDNINNIEQNI